MLGERGLWWGELSLSSAEEEVFSGARGFSSGDRRVCADDESF